MPRRMPVLSENHMFEMPSEFVDLWYERISIGYRKRTSRTEVILNVDYQERFHKGGLSIEENQKPKGVASCSFWQIGPNSRMLSNARQAVVPKVAITQKGMRPFSLSSFIAAFNVSPLKLKIL